MTDQRLPRVPTRVKSSPGEGGTALTPDSLEDTRSETASVDVNPELPIRGTPQPEAISGHSLDILGQRPKFLLSAINELQAFGVDSTIPLPKIVVVGDQSAGKSSLIEAISEIKVPRDSGCCTRCPLQLNLRNNEAAHARWTCSISLVKKFTYAPGSDASASDNLLHPWIENAMHSVTPFSTVFSKDELEAAIRRAQVATLNPQNPPSRYMNPEYNDHSIYVQFSPNIISLEIYAPNIPNLSFYDLPGVISQSRDGRKDTIHLVRELVRRYVGQENTLVLLAVPFESDIDNSKASAILSEEMANDRTIGVLTKPDRLQSDDRVDNWAQVLRGEAFTKGHGYYVVKQPSQQDLGKGISHAEARAQEDAFFKSEFWTNRFHGFEDRLGTSRLQQVLSNELAKLILKCLPTITEKVHLRLAEINEELRQLPDPPANALYMVNKALADFIHCLRTKIDGDLNPSQLTKAWKNARKVFHKDITINQRPLLIVSESIYNPNSPGKKLKIKSSPSTPSKRGREESTVVDLVSDEEMAPTPTKKLKPAKTLARALAQSVGESGKIRFRLDEIRDTLNEYSSSGLPGSIEPKAVDRMILSALVNWKSPLDELFKSLRGALGNLPTETLNESVSEWKTTHLYKEMMRIITTFVEFHVGELQLNIAARALKMEQTKPLTTDIESLHRCEREEGEIFKEARFKKRSEVYFETQDMSTGRATSAEEREKKRLNKDSAETIKNRIGADPFAREVEVMAKIRGYYKIASVRFVDIICQAVENDLFLKLRDDLQHDMEGELRLTEPDCHEYATKLLDDDPARAERRMALKKQRDGLEKAERRIEQLNQEI